MPAKEYMSRRTIIEQYRERIAQGRRIKLFGDEFEELMAEFIKHLAAARSKKQIEQLCGAEIKLLEEGYKRQTLAGDYFPRYRKAIEQAIADGVIKLTRNNSHSFAHQQRVTGKVEHRQEHWSLTLFKYDKETYEQLDLRQSQPQRIPLCDWPEVQPQRYLAELEKLRQSYEDFQDRHRAIAIVGLTGLRLGELLAPGQFTITDHPYLLHFEGPEGSEMSGFDFITLVPAWELILDILNFRARWEIKELMKLEGEAYIKALNTFDTQVNRECHKYLANFVPRVDERKRVTLLVLRSVWEAISLWMFCSPLQDQEEFTRQHLVRGMGSTEFEQRLRYRLVNDIGRPITLTERQGWMLDQVPTFSFMQVEDEVVWEESSTESIEAVQLAPEKTQPKVKELSEWTQESASALRMDVLEQLAQMREALQTEWTEALLELRDEITEQMQQSGRTDGTRWLSTRLRSLEQENRVLVRDQQALVKQRDVLKLEIEQDREGKRVQTLEEETRSLSEQLAAAQAKLEGFRKVLLGNDS